MTFRTTIERQYLTTREVAELCRTSTETLRYWRHVGKGPRSFKPGRLVLYAAEDVQRWLDEQRSQGDPEREPAA